ncbi:hypothetical protein IKF15_03875 [Candidatus Saccharibacteria bacterium]|nr:hypothetical protein [Candidatus Saccharibacteria bacterium]
MQDARRKNYPLHAIALFATIIAVLLQPIQVVALEADEELVDRYITDKIMFYKRDDCSDGSNNAKSSYSGTISISGNTLKEKIWSGLRSMGFSEEHTAGIMGNIQNESTFYPTLHEGLFYPSAWPFDIENNSHTSYGIGLVQWSFGNRVNFLKFVREQAPDLIHYFLEPQKYGRYDFLDNMKGHEDDIDKLVAINLEYLKKELFVDGKMPTSKDASLVLSANNTVEAMAVAWSSYYEGCGPCRISGSSEQRERISDALAIYNELKGTPVSAPNSATTSTNSSTINSPTTNTQSAQSNTTIDTSNMQLVSEIEAVSFYGGGEDENGAGNAGKNSGKRDKNGNLYNNGQLADGIAAFNDLPAGTVVYVETSETGEGSFAHQKYFIVADSGGSLMHKRLDIFHAPTKANENNAAPFGLGKNAKVYKVAENVTWDEYMSKYHDKSTLTTETVNVTWQNGWIESGIDGYIRDPAENNQLGIPVDILHEQNYTTQTPKGNVGPNKITLHNTQGTNAALTDTTAMDIYRPSVAGGDAIPPHFTVDLKEKRVYQHFPITHPAESIKQYDTSAGVQIEIVGYSTEADKNNDWYLLNNSIFGDAEWLYLAKLLVGIRQATGIPLISDATKVQWKTEPPRLSADDFENYQGILAHMHTPAPNDHTDTDNIWQFLEPALKKVSIDTNTNTDACNASGGASSIAATGDPLAFLQQYIADTNYLYGTNYDIPVNANIDEPASPATPNADGPVSARPFNEQTLLSSYGAENIWSGGCWHGQYCGQCAAFSGWFVSMMTKYKISSDSMNGYNVTTNVANANSELTKTNTISNYSVFSTSDGGVGHTGVVLWQDSDGDWIIAENNWHTHKLGLRKVSEAKMQSEGATYVDLSNGLKLDHLNTRY